MKTIWWYKNYFGKISGVPKFITVSSSHAFSSLKTIWSCPTTPHNTRQTQGKSFDCFHFPWHLVAYLSLLEGENEKIFLDFLFRRCFNCMYLNSLTWVSGVWGHLTEIFPLSQGASNKTTREQIESFQTCISLCCLKQRNRTSLCS